MSKRKRRIIFIIFTIISVLPMYPSLHRLWWMSTADLEEKSVEYLKEDYWKQWRVLKKKISLDSETSGFVTLELGDWSVSASSVEPGRTMDNEPMYTGEDIASFTVHIEKYYIMVFDMEEYYCSMMIRDSENVFSEYTIEYDGKGYLTNKEMEEEFGITTEEVVQKVHDSKTEYLSCMYQFERQVYRDNYKNMAWGFVQVVLYWTAFGIFQIVRKVLKKIKYGTADI